MKVFGWELILSAEIKTARGMAFAWGTHDCATWALSVRSRLLGRPDLMPEWVGAYCSQLGAARYMRSKNWDHMRDLAESKLGESLGLVFQAKRGDIILSENALGVCGGATSFFVGVQGVVTRQTFCCERAWRT